MREHPWIGYPPYGLFLFYYWCVLEFQVYSFFDCRTSGEIRSGIFSKKHLNLPFKRHSNVKMNNLYHRAPALALQLRHSRFRSNKKLNWCAAPDTRDN